MPTRISADRIRSGIVVWLLAVALLAASTTGGAAAQNVPIRDLTLSETDIPVRLMGYGLVTGLEGTGDRVIGGVGGGMTVRSIANLIRRFGIEVPEEVLRSRNAAAVLVTGEASPYLRPGGRISVHVSSMGDATSLRGGILWATPLTVDASGIPVALAQGPIVIGDGYEDLSLGRQPSVETTGSIPGGAVLEQSLPAADFASSSQLLLRQPDLTIAQAIVDVINGALGQVAALLDPGAIALTLDPDPSARAAALSRIGGLTLTPVRASRVLVDGRSGTVVAGGEIGVGPAVVSHGGVTLSIGGSTFDPGDDGTSIPGALRVSPGASVQEVAEALHAIATPPASIAAIFTALREVGALSAQVVVR